MIRVISSTTVVLGFLSLVAPAGAVPVISSIKDDATAAATRKVAGDSIDYTIQVSNTGADPATGVVVTDPTPADSTLVGTSVNVSPLAVNDNYTAIGNTLLRVGGSAGAGPERFVSGSVTANDTEYLGDEFTLTAITNGATTQGGTVDLLADGTFTYLPAAGFEGTDTFTYTIRDDGTDSTPGNADDLTGTGTVTITVNEVVWYVDDSAVAGGTGRSNAPLQSLAPLHTGGALEATDEADDYIFVYSGNYSGTFLLEAGQRLIGQPAGLTVSSTALVAAGGTRPAFTHNAGANLTLASGNTVSALNFTNTNGSGISGSAVGTLTLSDFDITATGGTALNLTTSGTVIATGADNDLSAPTGTALNVVNVGIGAAGLNFRSISSGNNTAAADPANGVVLNNTGTAAGNGGLTVTGDGGAANNASGGTIQNTTGPGILLNTTKAAVLNYMTITASGDDGISGTSVTGLTINRSNVTNNGNALNEDGVDFGGSGVVTPAPEGLFGTATVTNSVFTGNYYNQFTIRNSSSTVSLMMTGCTVTGRAAENNNNDGLFFDALGTSTITGNIQSSTFSANKGDHFQAAATNSGDLNVIFKGNTLTGGHSSALGQGITLNAALGVAFGGYTGQVTYDIDGNNFNGAISNSVAAVLGTSGVAGSFTGKVRNNIIGTSGIALSGSTQANGVYIDSRGNGTHTSAVTGNIIRQCFDRGILAEAGDGNPVVNLTVTGNTIDQQVGASTREAIQTNFGITSTNVFGEIDTPVVSLTLGGAGVLANTFSHGAGAPDDFRLRKRFECTVRLPGYSGGTGQTTTDLDQVVAFIRAQNTGSGGEPGSASASGTGGGYINGPATPQPLLFAQAPAAPLPPGKTAEEDTVRAVAPPLAPEAGGNGILLPADLDGLLSAAITRWELSGLTGAQLARMQRMTFTVEEIPGACLGKAEDGHITLDASAAGNQWFIDRTPGDDGEFSGSGTRLAATANGSAEGRVDALTTIVHELGHAVGLEDSYLEADRDSIMYGFLHLSERRLPRLGQAADAMVHNHSGAPHTHYLAAPINIGTLPPGKTLTVVYRVTVNTGITAPSVSNQGTVSGSNFANVLTDDTTVAGAANPTVTVVQVPPVVSNFARTTAEDTVLAFTAANFTGAYSDANSDALTSVRITSLPANGTLKLVAANVTLNQDIPLASLPNLNYTPAADYNGVDSFNWNASDGSLLAVSGATVNLAITEVNDAVVAGLDPQPAIAEDSAALVIAAATLTSNDIRGPANESTQTLTLTAVGSPVGGTVALNAGNVTFTLTPNFNGAASFQYTFQDNGTTNGANDYKSGTGLVSFTITEVNDAPVAVDDTLANVAEDAAPVVIAANTLAANDNKGATNESAQTLTVSAVGNPIGGTVALSAGNVTFTLTPNYNGPASFEYTVTDNGTTNSVADPRTDTGLASFTITSVNDNPTAGGDTIQRYPTQSVKVAKATLLSNDADGDGGTVAFVSVSAASANGGTITSDATSIFYTPAPGFTTADSFTYTINDGQGGTANGTVTVALVNDLAQASNITKIEKVGDVVTISFAGIPGRTYTIQSTENLTTWNNRTTVTADAQGKFQFIDGPVPVPPETRYYRSVQP